MLKVRAIRIQIREYEVNTRGFSEGKAMKAEYAKAIADPEEFFEECESNNIVMERID